MQKNVCHVRLSTNVILSKNSEHFKLSYGTPKFKFSTCGRHRCTCKKVCVSHVQFVFSKSSTCVIIVSSTVIAGRYRPFWQAVVVLNSFSTVGNERVSCSSRKNSKKAI